MNVANSDATGALRVVGGLSGIAEANRDFQGNYAPTFDASLSSHVYQNNAHVRPLSLVTSFLISY